MTAWNSISQDQLTSESQVTWILLMRLVKKKKSIYTKNTRDRTAVIHMYEPFSFGCWSSPSQPAFLFFCGLKFHRPLLAGLCARSLTCSSGFAGKRSCSRHIPATSELKLSNTQAELPSVSFHCQGRKGREPDPSPMTPLTNQAAILLPQNLLLFSLPFFFTKYREKNSQHSQTRPVVV